MHRCSPAAGHGMCYADSITKAKNGAIWFATSMNEVGVSMKGVKVARLDTKTGIIAFFLLPASFVAFNQMLTLKEDCFGTRTESRTFDDNLPTGRTVSRGFADSTL